MTNRQIKVCKIIRKYRKLPVILKKSKISDYLELQEFFEPYSLEFSDDEMDEHTEVFLKNHLIEEVETCSRQAFNTWFTRVLSILAFVISVIALLGQLGILQLPKN